MELQSTFRDLGEQVIASLPSIIVAAIVLLLATFAGRLAARLFYRIPGSPESSRHRRLISGLIKWGFVGLGLVFSLQLFMGMIRSPRLSSSWSLSRKRA